MPEHMLMLFDDQQWPLLRLEFQPTLISFGSEYDVVSVYKKISEGMHLSLTKSDYQPHWVYFRTDAAVVIQQIDSDDNKPTTFVVNKSNRAFADAKELLIDIGVTLPTNATFEVESNCLEKNKSSVKRICN